jgi:class 3 adenylate cyclase
VLATILCVTFSASRSVGPSLRRSTACTRSSPARRIDSEGAICPAAGDRAFSAFDGPARAIRCGRAIVEEASHLGLAIGVGLHTGEWDKTQAVGEGPVAAAAARIAALAQPGEVLVSRTVVDLVGKRHFNSATGSHDCPPARQPQPLFAAR